MKDREQGKPLSPSGDGETLSHPTVALVDWQINEAVESEGLISEGYEPSSARYATYEAHASDYVQILGYSEDHFTVHSRRKVKGGMIWIHPGETLKIYTSEVFNLNERMYAMATGLGQLYACGLTVACTYIDPGSTGALYLAVTNISPRLVGIPVGSPIARIQFWRLGQKPNRQHPGHRARREIELHAQDGGSARGGDPVTGKTRPGSLDPLLGLLFVMQTFFFVGLLWFTNPEAFNKLFLFAAGDNLPPVAHFLVPVVFGPLVFLAIRGVWRLIAAPVRGFLQRAIHSASDKQS